MQLRHGPINQKNLLTKDISCDIIKTLERFRRWHPSFFTTIYNGKLSAIVECKKMILASQKLFMQLAITVDVSWASSEDHNVQHKSPHTRSHNTPGRAIQEGHLAVYCKDRRETSTTRV